jgi:hypothetical protein
MMMTKVGNAPSWIKGFGVPRLLGGILRASFDIRIQTNYLHESYI